ncbi:hypothetical protein FOL47_009576 [Perkinsus chesapeaki]|uniref:Uncharacterized protein n=1 Tax=Perkinsus chesapeaki TaxID=330153 RepID=A0A7J6MSJ6_PERCH|nr:hypothetical protein FOL47_009576 [Perkinsus chesapeaki]
MDDSTIAAMLKSKQQAAREIEQKLDQTLYEVQVLSHQQQSRPDTAPQRPHGHPHFTVPAKPVVGLERPNTAPHGDVWQEYSPNRMSDVLEDDMSNRLPYHAGTICV